MSEVGDVNCQSPKQKHPFQLHAEVLYCSLQERFLVVRAHLDTWVPLVQSCSILYLLCSARISPSGGFSFDMVSFSLFP